jgi:hypothetical protein
MSYVGSTHYFAANFTQPILALITSLHLTHTFIRLKQVSVIGTHILCFVSAYSHP